MLIRELLTRTCTKCKSTAGLSQLPLRRFGQGSGSASVGPATKTRTSRWTVKESERAFRSGWGSCPELPRPNNGSSSDGSWSKAGDSADSNTPATRSQSQSSHGTSDSWSCCGSTTCKGPEMCQKIWSETLEEASADVYAPWNTTRDEAYLIKHEQQVRRPQALRATIGLGLAQRIKSQVWSLFGRNWAPGVL